MIERSSVFLLAIVLGAVGIWLASPHAPLIRQRRTAGWILASLSLLLLAWQLPRDTDNITGVLSLIVSATLPATAAGTIVIEQTRNAAGCFGLLLLAVFALFLLIGAWPMALVVTLLLVAAFSAEKFMPAENKQSWFDISRETDSWEPMLASAVGAVVVGVLAMPISRVGVGDASATAHNMAIAGVLLLGIGLVG